MITPMDSSRSRRFYLPGLAFLAALLCVYLLLPERDGVGREQPQRLYALAVQVTQPNLESYAESIPAIGEIAAWETSLISAEIDGLQVAEIRAEIGDRVAAGQVLAILEDSFPRFELERLKAQEREATVAWGEAQENAQRARRLRSAGAMAEQQIASLLAEEKTAAQRLDAIRAQLRSQTLRLERSRIIAPDAGVILSRSLNKGQVVGSGQELFRLLRQGRLEWRARLGSADLARIAPQGLVEVRAGRAGAHAGTVRTITPDVDSQTREAIVYVSLPASLEDGLFPGMFAEGEFMLGQRQGWSLPRSALVMRDGQSLVFKVAGDSSVRAVPVSIQAYLPGRLVVSGVDGADRVVLRGGEFLSSGDLVRVQAD